MLAMGEYLFTFLLRDFPVLCCKVDDLAFDHSQELVGSRLDLLPGTIKIRPPIGLLRTENRCCQDRVFFDFPGRAAHGDENRKHQSEKTC